MLLEIKERKKPYKIQTEIHHNKNYNNNNNNRKRNHPQLKINKYNHFKVLLKHNIIDFIRKIIVVIIIISMVQ